MSGDVFIGKLDHACAGDAAIVAAMAGGDRQFLQLFHALDVFLVRALITVGEEISVIDLVAGEKEPGGVLEKSDATW